MFMFQSASEPPLCTGSLRCWPCETCTQQTPCVDVIAPLQCRPCTTQTPGAPLRASCPLERMDQDPAACFEQNRDPEELGIFQGEKRAIIQPTSLKDPKLEKLKEVLVSWINGTLKPEHIVVQSLEEDLYDGLVLHHLYAQLSGVRLPVEEIAVTSEAQIYKLEVIMEALNQSLGVQDLADRKWSVKLIHSRDFLATLHLLVAMVRQFHPDLALPSDVSVEVILLKVNKHGIKSDKQTEHITEPSNSTEHPSDKSRKGDPIDELLKLDSHKIDTVKQAVLHFVNKNVSPLGLKVTDMEKQFADGVILLLLLGQLEGYFVPLCDFNLTPTTYAEMTHNVALALELLNEQEQVCSVDPGDIVSQDCTATLKVLYACSRSTRANEMRRRRQNLGME
ncbi:hypothetical protein AAFF_G00320320 [Aldrovandia affinis]|uniref:Calponin-homology (CH) domain-containing protein n=1 Tax=Aldrovandia affinis TaxID=143900 RepID=A0AAD7R7P1_9TELE|nr:hypothetical protein AAFF_G00320320 [Aldrovandia affinis]